MAVKAPQARSGAIPVAPFETGASAVLCCDAEGRITSASRAAAQLLGPARGSLIGQHLATIKLSPALGQPLAEGELDAAIVGSDGAPRTVHVTLTRLEGARSNSFSVILRDLSGESPAERLLRESYQRFRDIADIATDWIWETDGENRFTFVSEKIIDVSGRPASWFIGKTVAEVMETSDDAEVRHHTADLEAHRPIRDFVYWIDRPIGRRCCSVTGYPQFDEAGRFKGYRGVGTDITELRLAQERQELLLSELHHRLGNTMAVVDAVLAQTMRHTNDLAGFATAFRARLAAISRSHKLLADASWSGLDLSDVLQSEACAHGAAPRLSWGGHRVTLGPNSSVTFSLIFHELITNSLKYGALSAEGGTLRVTWENGRADENDTLRLAWVEEGGPPPTRPERVGFGHKLIERAVAHQFSGSANMAFRPQGLACELTMQAVTLGR